MKAEKIFSHFDQRMGTELTPQPVLIVGATGGTNVAASLFDAAKITGTEATLCDIDCTMSRYRFVNSVFWRIRDRRPPFPGRLARNLNRILAGEKKPRALLSVGLAPVERPIIEAFRGEGVACLHYSTDDPWSLQLTAKWHFDALRTYDIVFTPRSRNLGDLKALPCRRVEYLPFGYDTRLFSTQERGVTSRLKNSENRKAGASALFVGGADDERALFFESFLEAGGRVCLVGGYWDRWKSLGPYWLGHRPPEEVVALTRLAPVSIILVRQANRDGHTMRTFEAAAAGACLLVERTGEHRQIFGEDGEAVRFFSKPDEAARIFNELLSAPIERRRLALAGRRRIMEGRHSYGDRLLKMLEHVHNASGLLGEPRS